MMWPFFLVLEQSGAYTLFLAPASVEYLPSMNLARSTSLPRVWHQVVTALQTLNGAITPAEIAKSGQEVEKALETADPQLVQRIAEEFESLMADKLRPHIDEAAPAQIRAACSAIHAYVARCIAQRRVFPVGGHTAEALQLLRDYEDLVLWLSTRTNRFEGRAYELGNCREVMSLALRYGDLLDVISRLHSLGEDALKHLIDCIMAVNGHEFSQENVFMLDLDGLEINIKRARPFGTSTVYDVVIEHGDTGIVYKKLTWNRPLADPEAPVLSKLHHYLSLVGHDHPSAEFRGLCDIVRAAIRERLRNLGAPILLSDLQWVEAANVDDREHRRQARVLLQAYREQRGPDNRFVLHRCLPADTHPILLALESVASPGLNA